MAETVRLGVFGSAFNPPHLAHLVFAAEAVWQLELDRLIVIPTGIPYHKAAKGGPGPVTRFELAQAAFRGVDSVEVSDMEIKRAGPSYTYETLEEINDHYEKNEIHLLMGADAARTFSQWQRPDRVLELARVGIGLRPGAGREQVETEFAGLGTHKPVTFFEMPQMEISSSLIRHRIREEQPFSHLVPTAVAEMIENEDVYGIQ